MNHRTERRRTCPPVSRGTLLHPWTTSPDREAGRLAKTWKRLEVSVSGYTGVLTTPCSAVRVTLLPSPRILHPSAVKFSVPFFLPLAPTSGDFPSYYCIHLVTGPHFLESLEDTASPMLSPKTRHIYLPTDLNSVLSPHSPGFVADHCQEASLSPALSFPSHPPALDGHSHKLFHSHTWAEKPLLRHYRISHRLSLTPLPAAARIQPPTGALGFSCLCGATPAQSSLHSTAHMRTLGNLFLRGRDSGLSLTDPQRVGTAPDGGEG